LNGRALERTVNGRNFHEGGSFTPLWAALRAASAPPLLCPVRPGREHQDPWSDYGRGTPSVERPRLCTPVLPNPLGHRRPGRTTVVGAARPVSRAVLVHSKLFDLNQLKLQVYEIRRIEAKLPLRRPI
jgi:hypothetical protein